MINANCDCGAPSDGKWAGKHSPNCASLGEPSVREIATLTADAVDAIMLDCLYRNDELVDGEAEVPDDAVIVDGIVRKYGLHPERLASHKSEIAVLLAELPTEFQPAPEGGGGWSFLNACMDKNGRQWGEHRDMDALFVLGIATGQAAWLLPRDMWPAMPGGMPYAAVTRAA